MEIIPNWHPLLVHFTVALPIASFIFMLLQTVAPQHRFAEHWRAAARWNLWLGAAISVLTVLAGWYAFSTVVHDNPGHEAMLEHRAWALSTVAVMAVVTVWSMYCCRHGRPAGYTFLAAMLLLIGMIGSTGWHGAELVYRHGIGVMSLPTPANHHHTGAAAPHNDHLNTPEMDSHDTRPPRVHNDKDHVDHDHADDHPHEHPSPTN